MFLSPQFCFRLQCTNGKTVNENEEIAKIEKQNRHGISMACPIYYQNKRDDEYVSVPVFWINRNNVIMFFR